MRRLAALIPELIALVAGCLAFAASASAELVVVVNARAGVAAMSRNEVANIFLGRYRAFFNGLEAEPIDLDDGNPERARFYALLVGKSLAEINAYWSRQTFAGRGRILVRAAGSDEVLRWVAAHPGGIGFIDAGKADARVRVVYQLAP